MSGARGVSGGEVVLGREVRQGWWLVAGEEDGPVQVVAGPFADRIEAAWAAAGSDGHEEVRPAYGTRRDDGVLARRPSPQEWAWLQHLGEQLDRLGDDWDDLVSDDDPLTTLVVEVAAVLSEAGLPLHDAAGPGRELGGVCLTPEPGLGGIVVAWRQHDRVSVDRVHGAAADTSVQAVLNRALGEVLAARGFAVDVPGEVGGCVVRPAA